MRRPIAYALLLAATLAIAACGGSTAASSPSPRPAQSVTALPGRSVADIKKDPATLGKTSARVVEVFINDRTPRAKIDAMAQQIAAMPEVVAYHFLSKKEALARFAAMYPDKNFQNLPINPLPASFDILVRDQSEVATVARRFFHDPIVDSDPGTHNGVIFNQSTSPAATAPAP